MTDHDARAEQVEALAELGFGPPVHLGGLFGPSATSCLTCGAAVLLTPVADGETHPVRLHYEHHQPPTGSDLGEDPPP